MQQQQPMIVPDLFQQLKDHGLDTEGLEHFRQSYFIFFLRCKQIVTPQTPNPQQNVINAMVRKLVRQGPCHDTLIEWLASYPVHKVAPIRNAEEVREADQLFKRVFREPNKFSTSGVRRLLTIFDKLCKSCQNNGTAQVETRQTLVELCFDLARSFVMDHYESTKPREQYPTYLYAIDLITAAFRRRDDLALLRNVLELAEEQMLADRLQDFLKKDLLQREESSQFRDKAQDRISQGFLYLHCINTISSKLMNQLQRYQVISLIIQTFKLLQDPLMCGELEFDHMYPRAEIQSIISATLQNDCLTLFVNGTLRDMLLHIRGKLKRSLPMSSTTYNPKEMLKSFLKYGFDSSENERNMLIMADELLRYHSDRNQNQAQVRSREYSRDLAPFYQFLSQNLEDTAQVSEIIQACREHPQLVKTWGQDHKFVFVQRVDGAMINIAKAAKFQYSIRMQDRHYTMSTFREALNCT